MRRSHPLWRGFWLALVLVAMMVLLQGVAPLLPWRLDRRGLVCWGAVTAGAFVAALPGRISRRRAAKAAPSWRRCLVAFLGGLAMALALGMAGDVPVLVGLMQGSTGAFAFAAAAWGTGFVAVRLMERRAHT